MDEILNTTVTNYSADNLMTNVSNVTTIAPVVPDLDHLVVRDIIYNHLGPAVCVFGMLTNIINLIVLTQNQLPESPYTHLTGLACTDFTALMLSFIYMIFSKDANSYVWRFYDGYIFIPIVNICTTSSVWITVLLTIERFLFVRHPLWAKDTCDRASAKLKVLMTIGAAAVFNLPRFFVFRPTFNEGRHSLGSTEFRTTEHFFYINWLYSICIHFIPLIVLCITNFYLVYAVHKAGSQRQKLEIRNNREAAWQREQRRLTITLISIVFLFIVCIIPSAFSDRPIAVRLFSGSKTEAEFIRSSFYFNLQYIANFLVWLELSLNFVLYLAFNAKFRKVMKFTATRFLTKLSGKNETSNSMKVHFKSGHSSTRNSMLNTNSLSMNSKGSMMPTDNQKASDRTFKDKEMNAPLMNGDSTGMQSTQA